MEIINRQALGLCQVCEENQVIGLGYGNKWVCGFCLVKLEQKLRDRRRKFFEELKREIIEDGTNTSTN